MHTSSRRSSIVVHLLTISMTMRSTHGTLSFVRVGLHTMPPSSLCWRGVLPTTHTAVRSSSTLPHEEASTLPHEEEGGEEVVVGVVEQGEVKRSSKGKTNRERRSMPQVVMTPKERGAFEAVRSERRLRLQETLQGKLILAPLTRGGNFPFRRLCADFGALVTMGEMAYARLVQKGVRKERRLLVKTDNEPCFGVQMAAKAIDEGVFTARMAEQEGAAFIDINCGCPIYDTTRRGLGAVMLRKPQKLAKLVAGIVDQVSIPLTVKIRLGPENDVNAMDVAKAVAEAGASALTIHGRTMNQRYSKAADWSTIEAVANELKGVVPVVGNGDILTPYEARRRLERGSVAAVMTGRGALIKPWLFQEFQDNTMWQPTAKERISVYRRLACYFKERFGDDAMGKRHSWYFLPWHFNFFCRYRPLPEDAFRDISEEHPLIQNSRTVDDMLRSLESGIWGADRLDHLLACDNEDAHNAIAEALWDASSDEDAVSALTRLADERLEEWQRAKREKDSRSSSDAEGMEVDDSGDMRG